MPDWKDGKCILTITAKTPRGTEVINREVQLKRSWQLMLSSDKPVYQPGQDDPRPQPGPAPAGPEAGRRAAMRRLFYRRSQGQRHLQAEGADQPLRHRQQPTACWPPSHRRAVHHRLQGRRHREPVDGRGEEVRPAQVQGRPEARSAVLPARARRPRDRPGQLLLRQAVAVADGTVEVDGVRHLPDAGAHPGQRAEGPDRRPGSADLRVQDCRRCSVGRPQDTGDARLAFRPGHATRPARSRRGASSAWSPPAAAHRGHSRGRHPGRGRGQHGLPLRQRADGRPGKARAARHRRQRKT